MLSTLALELAIVPGIILFILVWRMDKIEKEPSGLLWSLFFFGALTILSAMIIEQLAGYAVSIFINEENLLYAFIDNFLIIALAEECGKYFVLKKRTWNHPAFNFTFDGVVYAVVVGLGFATAENIMYVCIYGIGTAVMRALTAVPSHAIDGLFMGCYYGYARMAFIHGDMKNYKHFRLMALLIPVLIHGFYDFCLSTGYAIFLLLFWIFYITITIVAYRRLKLLSATDSRIL